MSAAEPCSFKAGDIVVKRSGKPFKSGKKTATVSRNVTHSVTLRPAILLEEDGSEVECRMCKLQETPGSTGNPDLNLPQGAGQR